ncbi:MAG: glutamate--tRNA ligase [Mariprofundus sp.]|nr:glutamate--tRNA ligase [Mariprofundus sp.]
MSPLAASHTPPCSEVVTRFAPSPTGLLHLGNVRTALLNWLYARKLGGRFLLRFEDTDQDRSEVAFIEAIKKDLNWLGLDWDGEPLFQSSHVQRHTEALVRLADECRVYRCFCSENQLTLDRKLSTSRGLPPRYVGRCRHLTVAESEKRSESEPFVWRMTVHEEHGEVKVHDALRGQVIFALRDLDDPVIVRSDGSFTFLLPNAIDDALDGVTHALRGDDHLTNSAYQVWLLEQLDFTPPVYLHHGLLLGSDGAKLSKRSGSHSVAELREEGLLPQALVQAMGRLGHPNMDDDTLAIESLLAHFVADHISTSAVRWSDDEMWRYHTKLLHSLPRLQLAQLMKPCYPTVQESRLELFAGLISGNIERAEEAAGFARLLRVDGLMDDEAMATMSEAGSDFFISAAKAWHSHHDSTDWKGWMNEVKALTGCKGKSLFMPLRVALSGALHGPELSSIISFLGNEGVAERLQDASVRAGGGA